MDARGTARGVATGSPGMDAMMLFAYRTPPRSVPLHPVGHRDTHVRASWPHTAARRAGAPIPPARLLHFPSRVCHRPLVSRSDRAHEHLDRPRRGTMRRTSGRRHGVRRARPARARAARRRRRWRSRASPTRAPMRWEPPPSISAARGRSSESAWRRSSTRPTRRSSVATHCSATSSRRPSLPCCRPSSRPSTTAPPSSTPMSGRPVPRRALSRSSSSATASARLVSTTPIFSSGSLRGDSWWSRRTTSSGDSSPRPRIPMCRAPPPVTSRPCSRRWQRSRPCRPSPSSPLYGVADPHKVAAVGHSAGGQTAFDALKDPRVDVAVGWAPVGPVGPAVAQAGHDHRRPGRRRPHPGNAHP